MHESQEPVNPYASPLTETPAAPSDSLPQGPFGLRQPLRGSGVILPRDVRRAVRLGLDSGLGCATLSLASLGLLVIVASPNSISPFFVVIPVATGACAFAPFLVMLWFNRLATTRQMIRSKCRDGRRREMTFREDTVSVCSATAEATMTWGVFSKCSCSRSLILLQSPIFSTSVVVPRSFFASQEDWDILVRLVKHKLPQNQPRPTADHASAASLPGDAMAALPQPASQEGLLIRGQGTLTYEEMQEALPHLPGSRLTGMFPLLAFACILLVCLPSILAYLMSGTFHLLAIALAVMMTALVLWLFVVAPRRELARTKRKGREPAATFAVAASEERLWNVSAVGSGSVAWSEFSSYRELEHLLLLYSVPAAHTQVLPRSFFREDDWQRLLELVGRKIPRCP